MRYKGNKDHPTNCGGFISVWFFTFLFFFLGTRIWVLYYKDGDEYFQSIMNHDPETNFIKLDNNNLNIEVSYIGSGNATNFDQNEYFTFDLHRYTSLTDENYTLPP